MFFSFLQYRALNTGDVFFIATNGLTVALKIPSAGFPLLPVFSQCSLASAAANAGSIFQIRIHALEWCSHNMADTEWPFRQGSKGDRTNNSFVDQYREVLIFRFPSLTNFGGSANKQ